jgi:hypothetical protein
MHTKSSFKATAWAALVSLTLPATSVAGDFFSGWKVDGTFYFLGASMSGDVSVKGVGVDVDTDFSTIVENLEFGAMGVLRFNKGAWSLATDVSYMGLGMGKNGSSADLDQWCVEPSVGYRLSEYIEFLGGVRYMSAEIATTVALPARPALTASGKEDWWDPIVGVNLTLPFNKTTHLNLRADIGGGHDAGLTWQVFPAVNWKFSPTGSMHAGYRWVYADYKNSEGCACGLHYFRYDVLTQGPQLGVTFRF